MATLVVCHVFINELLPLAFILKLGVGQLVRSSCSSFSNISFFHCPDLHCYFHRRRLPNIELFFSSIPSLSLSSFTSCNRPLMTCYLWKTISNRYISIEYRGLYYSLYWWFSLITVFDVSLGSECEKVNSVVRQKQVWGSTQSWAW